jgi:hypothetical protein
MLQPVRLLIKWGGKKPFAGFDILGRGGGAALQKVPYHLVIEGA